mgnify:FL=1
MLKNDLLHLSKRIVIEGSKSIAFGAGINIASQSVKLMKSGDVKFGKELLSALDISLKTLTK